MEQSVIDYIKENYYTQTHQYIADKLGIKKTYVSYIIQKLLKSGEIVYKRKNYTVTSPRLYGIFRCMKSRCLDIKNKRYKHYGGRGITICDEWLNSFQKFYDWSIENGYEENLSIDRIDNNGNYSPDNCRWTNLTKQANNTTRNVFITAFGETKTITEWSRDSRCKCSADCIRYRLNKNLYDNEYIISQEKIYHSSVIAFGEMKSITEWSMDKRCKISYQILAKRLRDNWPPEEALTILPKRINCDPKQ